MVGCEGRHWRGRPSPSDSNLRRGHPIGRRLHVDERVEIQDPDRIPVQRNLDAVRQELVVASPVVQRAEQIERAQSGRQQDLSAPSEMRRVRGDPASKDRLALEYLRAIRDRTQGR